jgi:cytochrome b561
MLKSSPNRYGRVAIIIHWVSAALIIGLMIAGSIAADMVDLEAKAWLLRIHAPLGTAVLLLTLFRLAWWTFADKKPDEVAGIPHLQALAARAVHGLVYVAIIGLAGSGIAMMVMSGAGDILFGNAPGPLPDFWNYSPRMGHEVMAWLMAALLAAHVGGALYHQIILKDRLLSRMGLGK